MRGSENSGWRSQFLVWQWDEQRYGLPIAAVERVVRLVEVCPVPTTTPGVLGIIHVEGEVVPVLSLDAHLVNLDRLGINHQLILVRTPTGRAALLSEKVEGLMEVVESALVPPRQVLAEVDKVEAVLKTPEGLVLVPDVPAWLPGPKHPVPEQTNLKGLS